MKKKIAAVLLTVLMMITMLTVTSFAEEPVSLSLTSEKVYAGDEFTLKLFISDNSKMSGAVIDISYDKSALQFVSAENGAILNQNANITIIDKDGRVRFTYLDPSGSVTAEGVLLTLRFKAQDNAVGETMLKVSVPDAANFITQNFERIPFKTEDGTVEIINSTVVSTENTETTTETVTEAATTPSTGPETTKTAEETEKAEDNKDVFCAVAVIAAGVIIIAGAVVLVLQNKRRKK